MKTIACIAVHGRHSLVGHTISRLYLNNKINHVICVGSEQDRQIIESSGAEYIEAPNSPLGYKWNQAFIAAKPHSPDACLLLGSNQWVSDGYIPYMSREVEKNMLVGIKQFNIVNFGEYFEMLRWVEYPKPKFDPRVWLLPKAERKFIKMGGRNLEPVGLGRMLRRDFLDSINWQPYRDESLSGLDGDMMSKLSDVQGTWALVNNQHVQGLKITSDKWNNINSFERYKEIETVKEIITPIEFLMVWFPDILQIKL